MFSKFIRLKHSVIVCSICSNIGRLCRVYLYFWYTYVLSCNKVDRKYVLCAVGRGHLI
jgi:hypothetical protein